MGSRRIVVALGGNALIRPGEEGTDAEQFARVREVAATLAAVAPSDALVVTHGNGPQVGQILLRSDLSAHEVPPVALDLAVAQTQGSVGTMLAQALWGVGRRAVVVVTHVVVDAKDPALAEPDKPVGRFYTREQALEREATLGWRVREDRGRGWRRVVASPTPRDIVELPAIAALLEGGVTVVCCGGGGVPVTRHAGVWVGVEAVIDKDRASALLARRLGAAELWVLTGVDTVMLDFGQPSQRALREASAAEARSWLAEGQFPAGSMGPKIEACLEFLDGGGELALITSPESLARALDGQSGTRIRRG